MESSLKSAKAISEGTSQQRPRSRPSDKHPVKRGNSSSSQNNNNNNNGNNMTHESKKLESTIEGKVNQNIVDESDEDGEEEYEPNFDEDEEETN